MEQFIVSARKYRPDTFESLIGQENIATTLRNSILRGQLAHAYLFCGPRGVGKTTTARIFAKSINCLSPGPEMEPCGVCESCLSFSEGRSYCIHELDAASNNSVDDIRNLTEMVRIPPQIGKYSVYIIDEVHMLSSAAFNAFLKTLEEPPVHAIFILATTEKYKILPTILSRCQTYDFNRISVPDIVRNLHDIASKEDIKIDEASLHVIAVKGDGSMRDALTLFDQVVAFCGKDVKYEDVIRDLNVLDYEYYFRITDYALSGDYISMLLIFDEILSKGFNSLYFIGGLAGHLRDLLVCKHASRAESLLNIPASMQDKYTEQAARCSASFIFNSLNTISACEAGYRQSGNQRLHIEFALMKLASAAAGLSETQTQVMQPVASKGVESAAVQPIVPKQPLSQVGKNAGLVEGAAVKEAPVSKVQEVKVPGMSLKDMMRKAEEREAKGEIVEEKLTDEPITEEGVVEAWKHMAQLERQAERRSLAATMELHAPALDKEEAVLTFFVGNPAQQDWVRTKVLSRLENTLRKLVNNSRIRIVVEVYEAEGSEAKEVLPYMPTEKANFLLGKSNELAELKKDLDLDVK